MKLKNLFKVAVGRSHRKLSANKRMQLYRLARTGLPGTHVKTKPQKRRIRKRRSTERFTRPPVRKSIRQRCRDFIVPKRDQSRSPPSELASLSDLLLRTAQGIRQNEPQNTAQNSDEPSGSDMNVVVPGPSKRKRLNSRSNLDLFSFEDIASDPCRDSKDVPLKASPEFRSDSAGEVDPNSKTLGVTPVDEGRLDVEPGLASLDGPSERRNLHGNGKEPSKDADIHGEYVRDSNSDDTVPRRGSVERSHFEDSHIPLITYAANSTDCNRTRVQRRRRKGQRRYRVRKFFSEVIYWLGLGEIRVPSPPPSHDSLVIDRHPPPSGVPIPYTLSRDSTEGHAPLKTTRSLEEAPVDVDGNASGVKPHRTDWIPPVTNLMVRRKRSCAITDTNPCATPLLPIREERRSGMPNRPAHGSSSSPKPSQHQETSNGDRPSSSARIFQMRAPVYAMHMMGGLNRLESVHTIFRQMLNTSSSSDGGTSPGSFDAVLGQLPFETEASEPSTDDPNNTFAHTIKRHIARMNRDLREFQHKIQDVEQGYDDLFAAFAEIEQLSRDAAPPPADRLATEDMIQEADGWIQSLVAARNSLLLKSDSIARLWTACKADMHACRRRRQHTDEEAAAADFMRVEAGTLAQIRQTIDNMPVAPAPAVPSPPPAPPVVENRDPPRQPYAYSLSPSPEDLPRPSSASRTWIRYNAQRSRTPEPGALLKAVSRKLGGGSPSPSPPGSGGKGKGKEPAASPTTTPPPAVAGTPEEAEMLDAKYVRMMLQMSRQDES